MKRMLVICSSLMLAAPLAALADSGPGCGIGAQIWKGKTGSSAHTSAATTNSIIPFNKYIGITVGTLGCDPNGVVENEYQEKVFVAENLDSIEQDVAQGGGVHLNALAVLKGISDADRNTFFSQAQANYDQLFANSSGSSDELLAALDGVMLQNAQLAKYVN